MSWPVSRLGEVISFIRGVTFKPDDQVEPFSVGSTVVMRTKNVQMAGLDQSDLIAVPSGFVRRKEQSLLEGDILISSANSWDLVGKASYVPKLAYEATAGGFISIVRAKESVVDSRYLYHWVACPATQHKIRHCGRQTTNISNLDVDRFRDLEIPLPPLPEQKRIAAILDKADAIRRKRQQAIQLADDFLRAVFLDMFGDPRDGLKIEDMLSQKYLLLHKDGNHGSNYPAKEEFGDDGVVFISAKDISDQDGSIDYASVAHLNESKARKLTIGWLKEGDVLLAHNATVGRVGLFSGEVDEALIGTSLTAFRPNQERLSSVYLFAALKYSGFQAQLKQNMGQSTRNQVPITAQRALKIPVGDLKRQRQFERVFIKLKQVKSNLYAGLKGSDEMFSSLSQRAFSGQL